MLNLTLNRFICFLFIGIVIFANSGIYANENSLVWVSRDYEGGSQCNDFVFADFTGNKVDINKVPKPYLGFENKKIEIIEEYQVSRAVCEACGCPSYSFIQYYKIKETDLEQARTLGFNTFDRNKFPHKFPLERYDDMRNRIDEYKEMKLNDRKLLDGRLKKKEASEGRNWAEGDWRFGSSCDLNTIVDTRDCPAVTQYLFYDNMMFIYLQGYQNKGDEYIVSHKSRNGFYSIKDDETVILEFIK